MKSTGDKGAESFYGPVVIECPRGARVLHLLSIVGDAEAMKSYRSLTAAPMRTCCLTVHVIVVMVVYHIYIVPEMVGHEL